MKVSSCDQQQQQLSSLNLHLYTKVGLTYPRQEFLELSQDFFISTEVMIGVVKILHEILIMYVQ